jgi:hypothetical protein
VQCTGLATNVTVKRVVATTFARCFAVRRSCHKMCIYAVRTLCMHALCSSQRELVAAKTLIANCGRGQHAGPISAHQASYSLAAVSCTVDCLHIATRQSLSAAPQPSAALSSRLRRWAAAPPPHFPSLLLLKLGWSSTSTLVPFAPRCRGGTPWGCVLHHQEHTRCMRVGCGCHAAGGHSQNNH